MPHDPNNLSGSSCADFAVKPFRKVDSATHKLPSPAFVSYAVVPEDLSSEGAVPIWSITHEAADSVRIHGKQERNE